MKKVILSTNPNEISVSSIGVRNILLVKDHMGIIVGTIHYSGSTDVWVSHVKAWASPDYNYVSSPQLTELIGTLELKGYRAYLPS